MSIQERHLATRAGTLTPLHDGHAWGRKIVAALAETDSYHFWTALNRRSKGDNHV